ncbi:type II secretion system F family protein [Jiangella endophytica]|uniref:type II secretion system F family protein n=1 Tax=Jiangella endophytica TaxID=1623398 RepID=UPI000E34D64B|nr:type II secretion system F family protein [Jiangella endophytica]
MTTLLAMTCAALAAVVALVPPPGVARLRSVVRHRDHRRNRPRAGSAVPSAQPGVAVAGSSRNRPGASTRSDHAAVSGASRALAAAIAGLAAFWLLGGVVGLIAGSGVAVAAWHGLGRLEPASRTRDRERVVAMLPLAADLMTAALSAGCPPAVAAETVGAAIGGPLGRALVDAAAAASVGVEPDRAWSGLAAEPTVRPLARALTAAMIRGTSPSPVLERVSADARDAARWAGEARARSLGARAAAPLGLCFLPAFVLVGVVPIIATSGPLLL